MNITSIHIDDRFPEKDMLYLDFELDGEKTEFIATYEWRNGRWCIVDICHDPFADTPRCHLCQNLINDGEICDVLHRNLHLWGKAILGHQSIRMKILFH